jgi:hypothetical protein
VERVYRPNVNLTTDTVLLTLMAWDAFTKSYMTPVSVVSCLPLSTKPWCLLPPGGLVACVGFRSTLHTEVEQD